MVVKYSSVKSVPMAMMRTINGAGVASWCNLVVVPDDGEVISIEAHSTTLLVA